MLVEKHIAVLIVILKASDKNTEAYTLNHLNLKTIRQRTLK